MIANGHSYPQMDKVKDNVPYKQPVLLFRNLRNGKFEDVTAVSGLNTPPLHSRRGLAVGDVNNDGKLDVLLLNLGEPPTLLINRTASSNHSAMFRSDRNQEQSRGNWREDQSNDWEPAADGRGAVGIKLSFAKRPEIALWPGAANDDGYGRGFVAQWT